jgi:hypothetical protein
VKADDTSVAPKVSGYIAAVRAQSGCRRDRLKACSPADPVIRSRSGDRPVFG